MVTIALLACAALFPLVAASTAVRATWVHIQAGGESIPPNCDEAVLSAGDGRFLVGFGGDDSTAFFQMQHMYVLDTRAATPSWSIIHETTHVRPENRSAGSLAFDPQTLQVAMVFGCASLLLFSRFSY